MTNYIELKRLAEAAKVTGGELADMPDDDFAKTIRMKKDYVTAASPDVTLQMIAALDVQAGSIEAVQAANQRLAAERDKLRTQNQALRDDKEVLLNHMDTFMRVSNDPAIYNLAKVVIERFAQAEGGV